MLSRRFSTHIRRDRLALWEVNKYLWMTLAFVLAYIIVAGLQGRLTISVAGVTALFLCAILDAAARSMLAYSRNGYLSDRLSWLFSALDIALASIAIAVTGGISSDLWLVYFVITIFECLFATSRHRWLIIGAVTLGYLAATLPQSLHGTHSSLDFAAYVRIFVSRWIFLCLVASLARRISIDAEERERDVARLGEQMAAADERSRIAREVHDGLGHALVSVILRLELCARLMERSPVEASEILHEEIPTLRAAWNEGRDMAFHLRPWERDSPDEPFAATIARHVARFAERTGSEIDFTATIGDLVLPPAAAYTVTRVVQEALTNCTKHARGANVQVEVACAAGELICIVKDDGQGFETTDNSSGMGLQTMQERARSCGGSLEIASQPGAGTCIRLTVPLA